MFRPCAGISFAALLSSAVFGQTPGTRTAETPPAFQIADVHVSPHATNPNMRGGVLRAGRYEIRQATMVDLIRNAYNVDFDKVLSGPSWLETDRFDVIAKAPPATSPEMAKLMLQTLLGERFKLVAHPDTKLLPTYALTVGKGKPKLKETDGGADTGCKFTIQGLEAQANGGAVIQPNSTITLLETCHNMTMAAFVEGMRTMPLANVGNNPIQDKTELPGAWDFTFKYSAQLNGPAGPSAETITFLDAVDKQLGLKLDPVKVPISVIVVDSVNRKATDNLPGVSESLPVIPSEFEVADIRLSEPGATPGGGGFQPSGRLDLRGYPLRQLIILALDLTPQDQIVGAPKWLDSTKVDLIAKMSATGGPQNQGIDIDALRPALKALLVERFKLVTHTEDRPVDAYSLSAVKPKLKAADPSNRTACKEGPGADGKDPRITNPVNGRLLTCLNMTMAQFAEELPRRAGGYLRTPALDSTGLEGAWDFTLNFAPNGAAVQGGGGGGRGGDAGPVPIGAPAASDPNGAVSLFDALTKQLGLKLEMQKRPMPVLVIDHIDEKPADN
jgi:uncharacterized protein (TIGR03435 family)